MSAAHDSLAIELIRALRGRRSCAAFSKRIGYRSNIVHRWEAGACWPTAARFLAVHRRVRPNHPDWLKSFFNVLPSWAEQVDRSSPDTVAAFLRHLKGKTPVVRIAEMAQYSRFSVARWLEGKAEPKLPEFLCLVDVCSRRLLDLAAAFEEPTRLPSIGEAWGQLQLAREAAYLRPWSHAVLRALELAGNPTRVAQQIPWLAERLGVAVSEVEDALALLEKTGQVERSPSGYRPRRVIAVDTSRDPLRARGLKVAWTETALARLQAGKPGSFGYSVFAVSQADLTRLRELHSQYVRAMQDVIASSNPSECVGLYCAQLLDLGAREEAG